MKFFLLVLLLASLALTGCVTPKDQPNIVGAYYIDDWDRKVFFEERYYDNQTPQEICANKGMIVVEKGINIIGIKQVRCRRS